MDPDIIIPLAGMMTGIVLGLPIIRLVVRTVERKVLGGASSEGVESLREEVRSLQETVQEMSDAHERLLDLEERLDFAERLLTREREQRDLPRSD